MGAFATGVTIVTGLDRGDAPGSAPDAQPVGFACQSFASVSLAPPLVLFCADHRGQAWPRMRGSGRFTVNVLAEGQRDVCQRFGSWRGAKFEGLTWELSRWETPSLQDVLLRVHCEVETVHVAGDHDVVIGRVLELEDLSRDLPMIFFRGQFGLDSAQVRSAPDLWGWGDHWG